MKQSLWWSLSWVALTLGICWPHRKLQGPCQCKLCSAAALPYPCAVMQFRSDQVIIWSHTLRRAQAVLAAMRPGCRAPYLTQAMKQSHQRRWGWASA